MTDFDPRAFLTAEDKRRWSGADDDPVSACPYDELTTRGKRLEWIHGWCMAHAEAEDFVKENARDASNLVGTILSMVSLSAP